LREGPAQSHLRALAGTLLAGVAKAPQARSGAFRATSRCLKHEYASGNSRRDPRCLLLRRHGSSTDITQSARTDPIDLPALIVAVIVIVPERVAESEAPEATMMREPPARTAEAMTAEPAAQAAEMSGAQRPTEVRAGTQMSAAHPATEVATTHPGTEVATTHPAQVSPAHSAAEMATTHSTAEMTAATATTTTTTAARPCVGRDAGASHR
jgi:hypothetical protein